MKQWRGYRCVRNIGCWEDMLEVNTWCFSNDSRQDLTVGAMIIATHTVLWRQRVKKKDLFEKCPVLTF